MDLEKLASDVAQAVLYKLAQNQAGVDPGMLQAPEASGSGAPTQAAGKGSSNPMFAPTKANPDTLDISKKQVLL